MIFIAFEFTFFKAQIKRDWRPLANPASAFPTFPPRTARIAFRPSSRPTLAIGFARPDGTSLVVQALRQQGGYAITLPMLDDAEADEED